MVEHRRPAAITLAVMVTVGPPEATAATGPGDGPLPPVTLSLPADFGLLLGIDAKAVFASPEYKGLLDGTLMSSSAGGMNAERVRSAPIPRAASASIPRAPRSCLSPGPARRAARRCSSSRSSRARNHDARAA